MKIKFRTLNKCFLHLYKKLNTFYHGILDKREGRCYMNIEERGGQKRCHHEMGSAVSKATCCCSVGKAWGSKCESCPGVDTEEYKTLCPGGTGYRPNTSTVNNSN